MFVCTDAEMASLRDTYSRNMQKVPDLKPLFGGMFADMLVNHTHWGWIDIDIIFGDMTPLVSALRKHHVAAFPDGVRVP